MISNCVLFVKIALINNVKKKRVLCLIASIKAVILVKRV